MSSIAEFLQNCQKIILRESCINLE